MKAGTAGGDSLPLQGQGAREGPQKDMISVLARPSPPRALLSAQNWRDCLLKDAAVSCPAIPVLGGGAADGAGPPLSRSSIGPDTELS